MSKQTARPVGTFVRTLIVSLLLTACGGAGLDAGEPEASDSSAEYYDTGPAQDAFSKQVTALTGDWVADYQLGRHQIIHPDIFNPQASDHVLVMYPAEPGGTPSNTDLLRTHFEGWTIGDVDNERPVSMAAASAGEPGVLLMVAPWGSYFGQKTSLFGIVEAKGGLRVPFRAECTVSKKNPYDGEKCLETVLKLVLAVREGALMVPPATAPVEIAGWSGTFSRAGVTALRYFDWIDQFAGRTSHIDVSAPMATPADGGRGAVEGFIADLYQDLGGEWEPGAWQGKVYVRELPHAEGPMLQRATVMPLPDGRSVIVSVRCYSEGYASLCEAGLEQVGRQLESGLYLERFGAFSKAMRP